MKNHKLAIHLIGEQIRNQVLITSLENLGFDCTTYTLNISEIVLSLLGYKQKSDELYQLYFKWIEKAVKETDYSNIDEKMREWSEIIYNEMRL